MLLARSLEYAFGRATRDQVTGAASLRRVHVEKRRRIRDTLGLLQIVRDDGDRKFLLQLLHQLFNLSVAIGSRAEHGSSIRSTSGSVAVTRALHRCCC